VVESVYSAVRTDSLYKADYVSSLKGQRIVTFRQTRLRTKFYKVLDLVIYSYIDLSGLLQDVQCISRGSLN